MIIQSLRDIGEETLEDAKKVGETTFKVVSPKASGSGTATLQIAEQTAKKELSQAQKVISKVIQKAVKEEAEELTKQTVKALLLNTITSQALRTGIKTLELEFADFKNAQKAGLMQMQIEKVKLRELNKNNQKLFNFEDMKFEEKTGTTTLQDVGIDLRVDLGVKQVQLEKPRFEEPTMPDFKPIIPKIEIPKISLFKIDMPRLRGLLGKLPRRRARYYYYEKKNPIADPKELLKRLW
jgi:hypothetical protein